MQFITHIIRAVYLKSTNRLRNVVTNSFSLVLGMFSVLTGKQQTITIMRVLQKEKASPSHLIINSLGHTGEANNGSARDDSSFWRYLCSNYMSIKKQQQHFLSVPASCDVAPCAPPVSPINSAEVFACFSGGEEGSRTAVCAQHVESWASYCWPLCRSWTVLLSDCFVQVPPGRWWVN